jgi:tRNA pseudouridine55 synthase
MNGLLLVDKPSGWTSFDVVAKIRGIIKKSQAQSHKAESPALDIQTFSHSTPSTKVKVGHTGTLDPLATGLMVVVVGSYCKRAEEFSKLDKTYEVTMTLGQTSTTGDEEGVKTQAGDGRPEIEEVKTALEQFVGTISQTPPIYSAIKVNGQRAYKLARAGKTVVLEARQVTINSITNLSYHYPEVRFTVSVSSGTYIRSLVEDIGKALGTGAYMSALRRTIVGHFELSDAIITDNLDIELIKQNLKLVES